jgi:molecular chaperone GrpE (heat shock protein)
VHENVENAQQAEEVVEEQADALAEVTRERDVYLDNLQRLKAEFDNYRKRAGGGEKGAVG